jgi:hypothetical protein
MPLPKFICTLIALVIFAVPAASAREKYSLMQNAQSDTAASDEKFDSFLENLINKIQTDIEQSLNKKEGKTSEPEEQFESSDSLDVITGDYRVPRSEIVERDFYLKDGTLTVEGVIRGNASVLRGTILVKEGGRITGNAHAIGGSVVREKNGVVEGEIRESSSDRTGFLKRAFARKKAYTFTPRWLHENVYSDNFVFRYNRVEGVYLGLAADKKFYWDGHRIISGYGSLGYGFSTHRWRGQLGLDRQFAAGASLFELGGEGHNLTDTKDDWIISQGENTAAAFFLREDYRDYFQRAGFSVHGAWYTKSTDLTTMINADYRYDEYESLSKNTNWSLFKNKYPFRENPQVNEGPMRSTVLTGGISTVEERRRAVTGWNAFAQVEFGKMDKGTMFAGPTEIAIEKNFTRAIVDVRRFQPLSKYDNLNVRVRFGSLKGGPIVQKSFELGGVNTLPAFYFKEFAGNRMMLGNVEYALNGRVFDDVDFWPGSLALIVFADAGNAQFVDTKTAVTDGFQGFALANMKSDLGFALGWHDGTARLGFAWRTDTGGPPMVFLRLNRPF